MKHPPSYLSDKEPTDYFLKKRFISHSYAKNAIKQTTLTPLYLKRVYKIFLKSIKKNETMYRK